MVGGGERKGREDVFPGFPIFGFCPVKYFPGHQWERKWTISVSSETDFSCWQRFRGSRCTLPQHPSLFSPRVPGREVAKRFSVSVSQKEEAVLKSRSYAVPE